MAVLLPSSPGPVEIQWQQLDFGQRLPGALGGKTQRVNRLGNRYRIVVPLPPMTPAIAGPWIGALNAGVSDEVRWAIRQVGVAIGTPGTVRVNGGAQAGRTLAADGFSASYAWAAGQAFSIITSGRRYVYLAQAAGAANGAGVASLPLAIALRKQPADNDLIEFAAPFIEGMLEEGGFEWTIDAARHGRMGFAISEIE